MDNNNLLHELRIMAQAVSTMEYDLTRLDYIQPEIPSVKAALCEQCKICRNSIFAILGGIAASKMFEDFTKTNEDSAKVVEDNQTMLQQPNNINS